MADREQQVVSKHDLVMAYKTFFTTQEGGIIIADLVRRFGHATGPIFRVTDKEPLIQAAMRDGNREVLAHINRQMEMDPAQAAEQDDTDRGEM